MATLRERSGEVNDTDPVVSLLYSLLRDFVRPGDLEKLVQEIEEQSARGDFVTQYTNGWLAQYAQNLAERLQTGTWTALTDEQRLRLIQRACSGCGTLQKPCYCTRDD